MFNNFILNTKPLMPNKIIMRNGGNVLTTGNFIQLTGQAKTCKTSVLGEIIMSLLDGKSRLGFDFEKCPPDKEVVFINTELSAYDFWEYCKNIVESVGEENAKNFKGLDGQSYTPALMKKSFQEYLNTGKPYVIIIDGIVDFVSDSNNQMESKVIVDTILAKCKQHECSIIVTLHQNPGNYTSKSRGHLGTHVEQKASGTLSTQRKKNYFVLRGDKLRSTDSFSYNFKWSEKGLIKCDEEKIDKDLKDVVLNLITSNITKAELSKKFANETGKSKNYLYPIINDLLSLNLITEEKLSPRKSIINKL